MGCGSAKEVSRIRDPNEKLTQNKLQVPQEDPDGEWEDQDKMHDPDLEIEINGKRYDKTGQQKDMYDRGEKWPEDNEAMSGIFEMETAEQGDQALAVKPFAGAICPPDDPPSIDFSAPGVNLTLEYVYGYRCFDTRQNVFYTSNGHVVYSAAAIGIVLNSDSNTQSFFGAGELKQAKGHSDDITALAIHPDKVQVATGEVGKNPKIIVWNTRTMQIIKEFRQVRNSRAVTSLAFSNDGAFLVSTALDNDHTVRVWDWEKGQWVHEANGGPDKILDSAFSPTEKRICTVGIKHIYFWLGGNDWQKKRGIFGKNGKMCNMVTVQFLANSKAITGGTNGCIYLWKDQYCEKFVQIHSGHASNHSLRVVGTTVLAGGSDKKVYLLSEDLVATKSIVVEATPRALDMQGDKILVGCRNGTILEISDGTNKNIMESHSDGEVWGLSCDPQNPNQIITTGDDNKVKVWDIAQRKCMSTGQLEAKAGPSCRVGEGASTLARTSPNQQARCVTVNQSNGQVAIGFNDGHWQVRRSSFQIDTVLHTVQGPKEWIEAMRFSPDGKWLAIGSHDNTIYIYKSDNFQLAGQATKHSSYITALDWSKDSSALRSTCGAYDLLFWTVSDQGKIEQNPNGASEYKNETWDTFSTHFGWPVQGIFGGVVDYTHVNRVDRSSDESCFAVANDWGLVEISNNPNAEGSKSKAYKAHSEHVTNVKWNDSYLFSTGGYDQCVMQWRKS